MQVNDEINGVTVLCFVLSCVSRCAFFRKDKRFITSNGPPAVLRFSFYPLVSTRSRRSIIQSETINERDVLTCLSGESKSLHAPDHERRLNGAQTLGCEVFRNRRKTVL